MSAPGAHRRALLTWLAVYPVITAVLAVLGPALAGLPLPLRSLVLTALVVPAVVYVVLPGYARLGLAVAGRWPRPAGPPGPGAPTAPAHRSQWNRT
ncbi:hypothetical protein [Streptomyces sp. NRRL S-87]|uniref:hypothetical protein n=1 Tax=Streptomyces sp. NRRL S-87 TaxID=1463920 RepID=UPI0007C5A6D5|nr:hypothetical protein [Streptomyces sp. NRRL S-87]